jgi:hypothetical protein
MYKVVTGAPISVRAREDDISLWTTGFAKNGLQLEQGTSCTAPAY